MALFTRYNNENILIRGIIAGVLNILNNQIKYQQIWGNSDDQTETINVPWYYNQSGEERFMQDFFTFYMDCLPNRKIDGNFDAIPRGVITYTGCSINSQRITSRYVQGRYLKEIDGNLEAYVSYLYSIPLNVKIDCEMWIDKQITALKIQQAIIETFYKTKTFYTYYKGLRIGSTIGFPEDVTLEKNINYSFESDNKIKITFQLEIETYQPVFDPTTEEKVTSKIKGFGVNIYPGNEKNTLNSISITSPEEGAIIPKGIPIWLEWSANSRGKIIDKVDIRWCYAGLNDFYDIELKVTNHEYYIWDISDTFTDFKDPVIIWEEDSSISVFRKPIVKIIPDLTTNRITSDSFYIVDQGYFITPYSDTSINIQLEMKDDDGVVYYTSDGSIWANVKNNILDLNNPFNVQYNVLFPGTVDSKNIEIHISDGNESKVVGILNNITIV